MQRELGGSERDLCKDNQDIWVEIRDLLTFAFWDLRVVYMNPWWVFTFAKQQNQVSSEKISLERTVPSPWSPGDDLLMFITRSSCWMIISKLTFSRHHPGLEITYKHTLQNVQKPPRHTARKPEGSHSLLLLLPFPLMLIHSFLSMWADLWVKTGAFYRYTRGPCCS